MGQTAPGSLADPGLLAVLSVHLAHLALRDQVALSPLVDHSVLKPPVALQDPRVLVLLLDQEILLAQENPVILQHLKLPCPLWLPVHQSFQLVQLGREGLQGR